MIEPQEPRARPECQKSQPAHPDKINVRDNWELKYWCKELNCSLLELISALYAGGNSTAAVRSHLRQSTAKNSVLPAMQTMELERVKTSPQKPPHC